MGTYGDYTGVMVRPESQRAEFNRMVEKLLCYGGMMQFDHVKMYGKTIALLHPVRFESGDEEEFHYNYFEDDAWESAYYDPKATILSTNKIGGEEFAQVISAVHTLYEVNDEEMGVPEVNGECLNAYGFLGWINHVLGTKYSMKKRARVWEFFERRTLYRLEEGYDDYPNVRDLDDFICDPIKLEFGGTEIADMLYIIHGTESLTEDEVAADSYPADILQLKNALNEYFREEEDGIGSFLDLLKQERSEREKITGSLSEIAKMSLVLPARVLVYLATELNGKAIWEICKGEDAESEDFDHGEKSFSFWETWKGIYKDVYHDEEMKEYVSQELRKKRQEAIHRPVEPVRTVDFLKPDEDWLYRKPEEVRNLPEYVFTDDDRLYWWDGTDEVQISDETDQWIKELAIRHKSIMKDKTEADTGSNDFLKQMIGLLEEAENYYGRVYAFQEMFYEFIQNGYRPEFQAALKLFSGVVNENKEAGKVIEYASRGWESRCRRVTHNAGRMKVKRFLAVMANRKLRETYFGF